VNNGRNKRERARLHNLARDERAAYEQDRKEDPEKYRDEMRYTGSKFSIGAVGAIAAMTVSSSDFN